jgi:hypothetical protein
MALGWTRFEVLGPATAGAVGSTGDREQAVISTTTAPQIAFFIASSSKTKSRGTMPRLHSTADVRD